jgi:hypothetical protein
MTEQFKISNIGKKTNVKWKFWSKFLTRTLPIYVGAMAAVPIPDTLKLWLMFGQTVIVATISALSELTAQE